MAEDVKSLLTELRGDPRFGLDEVNRGTRVTLLRTGGFVTTIGNKVHGRGLANVRAAIDRSLRPDEVTEELARRVQETPIETRAFELWSAVVAECKQRGGRTTTSPVGLGQGWLFVGSLRRVATQLWGVAPADLSSIYQLLRASGIAQNVARGGPEVVAPPTWWVSFTWSNPVSVSRRSVVVLTRRERQLTDAEVGADRDAAAVDVRDVDGEVLDVLDGGPATLEEVAYALGLPEVFVGLRLSDLVTRGLVQCDDCHWELVGELPEPPDEVAPEQVAVAQPQTSASTAFVVPPGLEDELGLLLDAVRSQVARADQDELARLRVRVGQLEADLAHSRSVTDELVTERRDLAERVHVAEASATAAETGARMRMGEAQAARRERDEAVARLEALHRSSRSLYRSVHELATSLIAATESGLE